MPGLHTAHSYISFSCDSSTKFEHAEKGEKQSTYMDMFALRYDDYDYGEVNRLLERGLKLYIKAVACYPDSSKTPLCPLSWTPVKASEKVIAV